MQRWGFTRDEKQRWRCVECEQSTTRNRNDNRDKKRLLLFMDWITSKASIADIAKREGVTMETLKIWFEPFWKMPPRPLALSYIPRILVVDGTVLRRGRVTLLVAVDGDTGVPVFWWPVIRENAEEWERFLDMLHSHGEPHVIICDAQKSLLKAIGIVYPGVLVQRCMTHVIRQARAWLTQHPKTRAGRDLLRLVSELNAIHTQRQKRRWIRRFWSWTKQYSKFLKERTTAVSGRWWYTHRKLRGVRSLLANAIPDLFRFVRDPSIPRTSNAVEGGVNARLKELIRCHRGISLQKKLSLCGWYLAKRQGQKPTQNLH